MSLTMRYVAGAGAGGLGQAHERRQLAALAVGDQQRDGQRLGLEALVRCCGVAGLAGHVGRLDAQVGGNLQRLALHLLTIEQ